MKTFRLILIAVGFFIFAKASGDRAPASSTQDIPQSKLTLTDATMRSQIISNVRYDLTITVDDRKDFFKGEETVRFQLSKVAKVFLDFQGGIVQQLKVNDMTVTTAFHRDGKVELPVSPLKVGENILRITFDHPYSKENNGLYQFKDPEDNRLYIYSHFEPYDASRMFPCFDQPDIKAKITLHVISPEQWIVTSTMKEHHVEAHSGKKTWDFSETPPLSPYTFSLVAGPFHQWSSEAGKIPLRLFARQSMVKYVHAEEWFAVTRKGLDFFSKYFDYPYPFHKYDQILVPDFNFGAMENIANVIFADTYIPRGDATEEQKEWIQNTILHEMAHMWFGNLVTMKWWNDLWLNESFATYMASLALPHVTQFKNQWMDFFAEKIDGYWEDGLVTTHPIEGTPQDTSQAMANIDGITYSKGAATLKQLAYFTGPEKFRDGVRAYFKKFAYSNAERKDFVGSVAQVIDKNLDEWSRLWLAKAGADTIEAKFQCEDGKILTFQLLQTLPDGEKEYRPHRTLVGLYAKKGKSVVRNKTASIEYSSATTEVKEFIGQPCPLLVNPNDEDHDYVHTKLDSVTLANLKDYLTLVDSDLTRAQMWNSLFDMVRVQQYSVQDYSALVLAALPQEKSKYVFDQIMTSINGSRHDLLNNAIVFWPRSTDLDRVTYKQFVYQLENLLWNMLVAAKPGSNQQKQLFANYVRNVESTDGIQRLKSILDNKTTFKKFTIDQDRRWRIISRLASLDRNETTKSYLEHEQKRDPSERGQQAAMTAKAALPNQTTKQEMLNLLLNEDAKLSLSRRKAIMHGLFPANQLDMRKSFEEKIYKALEQLEGKSSDEFITAIARWLGPFNCEVESGQRAAKFLNGHKKLPPGAIKYLRIGQQENDRCVKVREYAKRAE